MKLKWEEGGLCGGENEDIEKILNYLPIHDSFRLNLL